MIQAVIVKTIGREENNKFTTLMADIQGFLTLKGAEDYLNEKWIEIHNSLQTGDIKNFDYLRNNKLNYVTARNEEIELRITTGANSLLGLMNGNSSVYSIKHFLCDTKVQKKENKMRTSKDKKDFVLNYCVKMNCLACKFKKCECYDECEFLELKLELRNK